MKLPRFILVFVLLILIFFLAIEIRTPYFHWAINVKYEPDYSLLEEKCVVPSYWPIDFYVANANRQEFILNKDIIAKISKLVDGSIVWNIFSRDPQVGDELLGVFDSSDVGEALSSMYLLCMEKGFEDYFSDKDAYTGAGSLLGAISVDVSEVSKNTIFGKISFSDLIGFLSVALGLVGLVISCFVYREVREKL